MAYRINLKEYLDLLYDANKTFCLRIGLPKLTCKSLAERVEVTPATISNLNTDTKVSLMFEIAEEIFDYYAFYFDKINQDNLMEALEDESHGHGYACRSYCQYSPGYIVTRLLWEASWNGSKK